jgi:hypothetical protein
MTRRYPLEYDRRHYKVRQIRGAAAQHSCEHCGGPAKDWATVHDRDGLDPLADYLALCRKCHATYDERGRKVSEARTGMKMVTPMSEESRRKKGEAHRRYWANMTPEQRAERIRKQWPAE